MTCSTDDSIVLWKEFVPPDAKHLPCGLRDRGLAPQVIDPLRDWLEVLRVDAATHAAKVIDEKAVRNRADKRLV